MMSKLVGNFIKKRRSVLKLTQKQLSDSLGFKTSQFISNLERGIAEIPPSRIKDFAEVLQMDNNEFTNLVSESLKRKILKKTDIAEGEKDPFVDKFLSAWSVASDEDKNLIKTLISKVLDIE
ncbi:MAG: helix-turn-helix transcriptional regulator [Proteobacteria bacterium]|nr:helix-turn-helix transcriptional regulator [Pseudomonadota bacterium]